MEHFYKNTWGKSQYEKILEKHLHYWTITHHYKLPIRSLRDSSEHKTPAVLEVDQRLTPCSIHLGSLPTPVTLAPRFDLMFSFGLHDHPYACSQMNVYP